ncbi:hypothetical protein CgunFtcFv8_007876 [Champsocephalus gunnari]|uniref:Uncharacterized protein n=1 Tax=Champsocephalus gunnari TaxID=52237 RepID=A0AAN8CZB8_CHAGU|nr:hypothetical protein CgunFtcFv8_007876 [Champsocephalus gunnari]
MAGPEQLLGAKQKGHLCSLVVWLSRTPLFCHQTLLLRQSSRTDPSQRHLTGPPPPPCYALPFLALTPPFLHSYHTWYHLCSFLECLDPHRLRLEALR